MSRRSKNKIKLKYQYIKSPDSQEKLDDIFNFIFEETVRLMKLDKLQEVSYTYNDLENKGGKNERKRPRIPHRRSSIGKFTGSLANRSQLH